MALLDFDSIQFLGTGAAPAVTLSKPVGPVVTIPDGETTVTVDAEATFGIDGSGNPYFGAAGVAEGEHALLVVNTSGMAFLDPTGD